jgi:hypothetical protein
VSDNPVDRRPPAVFAVDSLMRRTVTIVAPVWIMLLWAGAAFAADTPDSRLSEDIALTKATISRLAAKDMTAVRDHLDPKIGQTTDDTLRKMSDMIGGSEPASIETIWATETHGLENGGGNSRIVLEYGLTGKWVIVDAVVQTEFASKRLTRLYFTVNTLPLSELNAFHLFGKGLMQYLFLAGWISVIVLTAWAMILAFRRQTGWRKWALIVLMPAGLTPTVAVNWNTGHISVFEAFNNSAGQSIPVLAFRYPMALYGTTELLVPYLYVSAPLVALGYLIWQWRSSHRRQLLASSAGAASRW